MKKVIVFLLILTVFTGFSVEKKEHISPKSGELVHIVLSDTIKIIKEKYKIFPCGSGVSMPGGPVRSMTLCFNTCNPYSKEQLRKMLVGAAEILLSNILNNDFDEKRSM